MAYFECTIGGASGDGVALIVQCDANFAGSTITADNGEDIFTETCPSASPYTVRFEGIPTGTFTISGVSEGQTITTQFTVLDYETTLNATPEGATVLPINDVQIWLHCANISDKNYTTISEVLADNTSLITLISSNNAVDYMVRSTGFATDVCANQTAMGYIGNNDYCADTLIADATWCEAICNSAYIESVLNVKVPTMTSNTTPSGIASANFASTTAWKVFDNDDGTYTEVYINSAPTNPTMGYQFTQDVKINAIRFGYINPNAPTVGSLSGKIYDLQGYNGSSWETIKTITSDYGIAMYAVANSNDYSNYQLVSHDNINTSDNWFSMSTLQLYGRA